MSTRILDEPARVAVVEIEIEIDAEREEVYRTFVERTGDWFYENEASRKTHATILEHELGGRLFIRTLANGDENMMASVTMIKKNRKLRLKGDYTVAQAFVANVTVAFEDVPGGTRVAIEHRMAGDFSDDLPGGFDEGWMDGLLKLKRLVEG